MTTTSTLTRLLGVAAAALMLCLPALWNRLPFFYPDTPTYLRGAGMVVDPLAARISPQAGNGQVPDAATPQASRGLTSLDDKVVLAGRSVYYGGLLDAGQRAGSLWLAVAAQALCVASVLHLLMVRLWRLRPAAFLGTTAVLALATPLAVYTGLLMPDVFAGLAVLSPATLSVYWRQLAWPERSLLAGVLLFGLLAHASHVAVAAVLLALALALRAWNPRWQGLSAPALSLAGACVVLAIAAEWAFALGVHKALGHPPLRLPYPSARLIEMGPGTELLRARCPEAGYALCAYRANYPTAWDAFLFSPDPARGTFALADADTKRRIVAQQWRFVGEVIAHDPLGVLRGWLADLGRQLVAFRVDIWSFGPSQLAMYEGRVPASTLAAMQASRGFNAPAYNRALTAMTYASTVASLLLGLWWALRRRAGAPARVPQRLEQVALLTIAGVVANALVCATAASWLDRFQSRVIWLLPFLALTVLSLAWTRRSARIATAPQAQPVAAAAARLEGAAS
ncbi:MAG: hypothetical protein RIS88_2403 [Pseudomonadota bacterium]|jgi:hypothetical protein